MLTQKHILLYTFLLLSVMAFGQTDKDYMLDIIDAERKSHESLMDYRFNELTTDYDIKYHRFDWEIDPAVLYIKGSVETLFETKADNFSTLHFDCSIQLQIDSVIYEEQALSFSQETGNLLVINLPTALDAGTQKNIKIYYQGEPIGGGFGSFAKGVHGDNIPMLWTLSEPYGAEEWWPCKQDLNDKIDSIDIFVKVPIGNRVASNGKLVDSLQVGNSITYQWQHRHPIPAYLIAIAITDYTIFNQSASTNEEPIDIVNYIYPEEVAWVHDRLNEFPAIMEFFNEKFIKYPFADEKYGHAHFGWGGGMEHTTMTFMGGWSYLLQAHELAHQWFGDYITCGSWEDIWLNEGFATYLEGINYENGLGDGNWTTWKQSKIDQITSQPDGSVWVNDTTSVGRIFNGRLTYSKGAMVLHMLRWTLGDDDFFQAVKNYLNDPELAYGYARTSDLKAHLEAESGLDLTEFFADWFYGEGYPTYEIIWSQSPDKVLSVQLSQITSHESVDFFEMPVPMQFMGGGESVTLTFNHEFNGQTFYVPLDFTIETSTFDPERWLVAHSGITVGTREQLLPKNTVYLSPNPANEYAEISLTNLSLKIEAIRIFDASGKLVFENEYPNVLRTSVDITPLAAGNYAVEVLTKEGIGILKMIKQ